MNLPTFEELLDYLQSDDQQTREAVMNRLLEMGPGIVGALITTLQSHEHPRVRQGIAQTLGTIGTPQAIPALLLALSDSDPGVWSQSVGALAKMGKSAEKNLRPAISSQNQRVKLGSGLALWRISREEKAFPLLLQALQDEEVLVRGSAINSLWIQPDERAVATLQIQLQQEEGTMAHYILQALQIIGTPMAQATIQHWMAEHNP